MVKRTPTSKHTSDPLKQYKDWRKTEGNNSYLDFIRENPYPNVSERFQGLPREQDTKSPTESRKRRRKTITKSKSKKNKTKKNYSKKSKK